MGDRGRVGTVSKRPPPTTPDRRRAPAPARQPVTHRSHTPTAAITTRRPACVAAARLLPAYGSCGRCGPGWAWAGSGPGADPRAMRGRPTRAEPIAASCQPPVCPSPTDPQQPSASPACRPLVDRPGRWKARIPSSRRTTGERQRKEYLYGSHQVLHLACC